MVSGRKPAALGVQFFWRKDGVPIWKNSDLIAKIENPREARIDDAERFAESAAEKLGVNSEFIMPAFEYRAIGCRRRPAFRRTSTRAIQSCPIRKSARAWRGYSIRD